MDREIAQKEDASSSSGRLHPLIAPADRALFDAVVNTTAIDVKPEYPLSLEATNLDPAMAVLGIIMLSENAIH
jgi:hypothetical protein